MESRQPIVTTGQRVQVVQEKPIAQRIWSLFSGSVMAMTIAMIVILVALIVLFIRTFKENWIIWLVVAVALLVMFFSGRAIVNNAIGLTSLFGDVALNTVIENADMLPSLSVQVQPNNQMFGNQQPVIRQVR